MSRRASRSRVGIVVAAALLAACGTGPNPSPTLSPAALPTATAAAAPSPTVPAGTPTPSESAVVCPSELPTALASVAELADPACYGSTELTIDGWLSEIDLHVVDGEWTPSWTMALSGLFAQIPTVEEWVFDFLMTDHRPGPMISVVTPPTSGIDLSGLGRLVTLRGHFADPAASACEVLDWEPDEGQSSQEPPHLPCERLFVVTNLEGIAFPSPVCPAESPLSHAAFLAADARCFIGREVKVSGWEDVGEGFGGETSIMPISRGDLRTADAQLVADRWESNLSQFPIFPMTVAGSGVSFDGSDLRVVVTGMFGHEAAESCRVDYAAWSWTPPDSWAVNRCSRLFVITGVRIRD